MHAEEVDKWRIRAEELLKDLREVHAEEVMTMKKRMSLQKL
jgi:hypothetical protein